MCLRAWVECIYQNAFPINTRSEREIKTESGVIIIEIGLAGRIEREREIKKEVVAPSEFSAGALC
jgi:hypothetical protein